MKTQLKTTRELWRQEAEDWIMEARKAARDLLFKRQTITIEDVLTVIPRPTYLNRNITGKVFQDDVFVPVGYTKSRRPMQHHSVIRLWSLNTAYFPESMLSYRRRNSEEYGDE